MPDDSPMSVFTICVLITHIDDTESWKMEKQSLLTHCAVHCSLLNLSNLIHEELNMNCPLALPSSTPVPMRSPRKLSMDTINTI